MNLILKPEWQKSFFPSGGFPYTDKRTGYVFDATAGNLNDRVEDVRKHRIANPRHYPDKEDLNRDKIRSEIIAFMCNRNPDLCTDVDPDSAKASAVSSDTPKPSHSCVRCGSWDAEPNYCVSCGGNKVKNYTCRGCGNVFNP